MTAGGGGRIVGRGRAGVVADGVDGLCRGPGAGEEGGEGVEEVHLDES